jgi:hypothetical protein
LIDDAPTKDVTELERVKFIMKAGVVLVKFGKAWHAHELETIGRMDTANETADDT